MMTRRLNFNIIMMFMVFLSSLYGTLGAASTQQWWILFFPLVVLLLWLLLTLHLMYSNRWKHYEVRPSQTFVAKDPELLLLAEHRDHFGEGWAENVISDKNFLAFEVVSKKRGRRWFYAVDAGTRVPKFSAMPILFNNNINFKRSLIRNHTWAIEDRYEFPSRLPANVCSLLAQSDLELQLAGVGNWIVASRVGMGPRDFKRWLQREATLISDIAASFEPQPQSSCQATISAQSPRNVWHPHHETADSQWHQPH